MIRAFRAAILLVSILAQVTAAAATLPSGSAAQPMLNLSQDLVSLGIASTNVAPNQPSLDAGPLLYKGVEYAKQQGIPWSLPILGRITS